jgi:cell shape-determining protein MreC
MRTLVIVTFVVVVLAVVDIFLGAPVRIALRSTLAPVEGTLHAATSALFERTFWSSRGALFAELESLRARVAVLEARSAAYEIVSLQNDELRALVKLVETEQGLTAPIISSFLSSPYGTFYIGVGSEEGVSPGNLVLFEGGFVLGIVSDVTPKTATVRAIFAPGETRDGVVDTVTLSLEGRGRGNARAQVPREAPLVEGQAVIVPSLGGRPVGLIGHIESATSSVYSTVHIILPVNLNSIRFVHIVPGVE